MQAWDGGWVASKYLSRREGARHEFRSSSTGKLKLRVSLWCDPQVAAHRRYSSLQGQDWKPSECMSSPFSTVECQLHRGERTVAKDGD